MLPLSPELRCFLLEEARDLCRMLADHLEELGPKQRTFVEEMTETVEGTFGQVTVKQLFWLRDIWEKFQ